MKKKLINLISVSCIIALLAVVLIGCNSTKKIDKFYDKLSECDSVTIDIEMEMPIFGTAVVTTKIDDNKTYTSGFMGEGEEYTEVIDNVEYTYTKVLGTWIKDSEELTEEDDETIAEDEYAELFNADNYEYDKEIDKYVLKEGVKTTFMEGMQATTLTLELTDNGCVFIGKVNSDGVLMPITITMKDLNNTEIVLPTV
ncbi:MAG: hypothetical protein WCR54_03335 [Clostridia bacterium]